MFVFACVLCGYDHDDDEDVLCIAVGYWSPEGSAVHVVSEFGGFVSVLFESVVLCNLYTILGGRGWGGE